MFAAFYVFFKFAEYSAQKFPPLPSQGRATLKHIGVIIVVGWVDVWRFPGSSCDPKKCGGEKRILR